MSVGLVCAVSLAFAALPRHEVQTAAFASGDVVRPPFVFRVDRWTGRVEVVSPYDWRNMTPVRALGWLSVLPVFDPVAPAQ